MLAFAESGDTKLGKGKTPRGGSAWHVEFEAIKACPKHRKKANASISVLLGGSDPDACICKWHDRTHPMVQKYSDTYTFKLMQNWRSCLATKLKLRKCQTMAKKKNSTSASVELLK